MKEYRIDEMKIILYAAGGLSCKVEELLYENGKKVEAYIDRRAEDIHTFRNKAVYTLEEAACKLRDKDTYVVIVTTKNVFEHSKIAAQLKDKGFFNIIYKDYRILQGLAADDMQSVDDAFEDILNHHRLPEGKIAKTESGLLYALRDNAWIKSADGLVYAYIPAGMLFTNRIENWEWSRVNFKTTFLTVQLYQEFGAGRASIREISQRYVRDFARKGAQYLELNTDGDWQNFVISGRMDVYREMADLFCLSPDFFVHNAPAVAGSWSTGFELVTSGKNRVAFLMARGYRYIPVKISSEVYCELLNLDAVSAIEEYLAKTGVTELPVPIPHPYFYKYPSKAPDYYEVWLERAGQDLMDNLFRERQDYDVRQLRLKIVCEDNGAAERYFAMLGMHVSGEAVEEKFTSLLNRLFGYAGFDSTADSAYDYAIVYEVSGWCRVLEQAARGCYVAGQSAQLKEQMDGVDRKKYNIEEIFTTYWDKKEYSGYVIRKAVQ